MNLNLTLTLKLNLTQQLKQKLKQVLNFIPNLNLTLDSIGRGDSHVTLTLNVNL